MKLFPFLVILWLTYIFIALYDGVLSYNLEAYGNGIDNWVFGMFLKPWNFTGLDFWTIFGLVSTVSIGAFVATAIVSKSDIAALTGLAGAILAVGSVPIITLYGFISRNVGRYACGITDTCGASYLIAGTFTGIIAVMWITTVLEWWMWRQTQ